MPFWMVGPKKNSCAWPRRHGTSYLCLVLVSGGRCRIQRVETSPAPATEIRWHYGPTAEDPEPGHMWHYDCGGQVMFIDDGYICGRCGMQQSEVNTREYRRMKMIDDAELASIIARKLFECVDFNGECTRIQFMIGRNPERAGAGFAEKPSFRFHRNNIERAS
jgi:hypothetical protein